MLSLWGSEADRITDDILIKKTIIKIVNGYVKEGFHGLEINIGKWGFLDINPEKPPSFSVKKMFSPLNGVSQGIVDIRGTIEKIEKTHLFIKDNGDHGFVTRVTIRDKTDTRPLVFWGEKDREIQRFREGNQISIRGAYIRKGEIHVDAYSTLSKM